MASPASVEPTAVKPQTAEDLSALFDGRETGEMVPMPHGGALRNGNPGNSGRPKQEVRDRWLELANGKAFQFAVQVLNDDEASPQEKIAAMNAALRFGLGTSDEVAQVKDSAIFEAYSVELVKDGQSADYAGSLAKRVAARLGLKE